MYRSSKPQLLSMLQQENARKEKSILPMEDVSSAMTRTIFSHSLTSPLNVFLVLMRQYVLVSIILHQKRAIIEFPSIKQCFTLAQIQMRANKVIKLNRLDRVRQATQPQFALTVSLGIENPVHMNALNAQM